MALDGPYTLDDLLRMTGHANRKRSAVLELSPQVRFAAKAQKTVRLIGIDPGTRFVGYGVIELHSHDNSLTSVEHGCIQPDLKWSMPQRLAYIFEELEAVVKRTRPEAAALEETFAGVNMKSAIAMGQGRGVAMCVLARAKLDILEIAPRSIKKAVTGSGAAGKEHVASLVCATLNLKTVPHPEDITDALAAAIALARRVV